VTDKKTLGYSIEQVDGFLAAAKNAYGSKGDAAELSAESIRHTAFAMQKGGYSPSHVDAALERLEDAFAAREREAAVKSKGGRVVGAETSEKTQEIVDRLSRASGHRFGRTSFLTVGYSVSDVDRFSKRIVKGFGDGRALTVDDVRTAVFRPQRGGYREAQVDLVLDAVVDVLLANG